MNAADKPLVWETPFGFAEVTRRGAQGPAVRGASSEALLYALGRLHAEDRRDQLILGRALVKGELSALFKAAPGTLDCDVFHRLFDHGAAAQSEADSLTAGARSLAHAYTDGVNVGLFPKRRLWDGLSFPEVERWTLNDSLLLARVLGLDSAFEQALPELRFLSRLITGTTPLPLIRELWPELEAAPDNQAWKAADFRLDLAPEAWDLCGLLPRWRAGTVFGVEGTFAAGGAPLLGGALVTEVSVWPSPFYEAVLDGPEGPWRGVGLPGVPGFLTGRTAKLAWVLAPVRGDQLHFGFEGLRGNQFHTKTGWAELAVRQETFFGGHQEAVKATATGQLWPGTPVSVAWAGQTAAGTLNALLGLLVSPSAEQAAGLLNGQGTAVLEGLVADAQGLSPVRMGREWQRTLDCPQIPVRAAAVASVPVSAPAQPADLVLQEGRWLPAGDARKKLSSRERLYQLLLEKTRFKEADLQAILRDDVSHHGQKLRTEVRFLFPETGLGKQLRQWSCRAGEDGAVAFEYLYRALIQGIFAPFDGDTDLWQDLHGETVFFNQSSHRFDRVLFNPESPWYGGRDREEVFAGITREFFKHFKAEADTGFRFWPHPHQAKLPWVKTPEIHPFIPGRSLVVRHQKEMVGSKVRAFGPAVQVTCDLAGLGFSVCNLSSAEADYNPAAGAPDWEAWQTSRFRKL